MNIRNPQYNEYSTIDCEIEHPAYGWIPFTASPDDVEEHGRAIYAAALAMGPVAHIAPPEPEPPTPEELLAAARASASLSRMEFFTALESIGLFDTVWAMQDDETVPKLIRIMIRTASAFDRMHPELVSMAAAMGITDEQLDALYGIGVEL